MKREDFERNLDLLSFDEIEEDDFMLNTPTRENKDIFDMALDFIEEDNKVDTQAEQDLLTEVELDEMIDLPKIDVEVLEDALMVEPEVKEELKKDEVLAFDIEEEIEIPAIDVEIELPKEESKKEEVKVEIQEEVKEEPKKEKKDKKNKKEKKVVEKNKFYYMQLVFVIISILFILGCCVFYGSRLVKYYKIYNPKNENGEKVALLGSTITSSSSVATEGSGLYKDSVHYVFKGSEVDNYVKYKNQLWRIIKIYQDGSIELVLDNAHNILMFNSEFSTYKDSDIRQYLNNEYVKSLDLSNLANVSFCEDTIDDITKITCEKSYDEDYVRLLGINDFINSKVDNNTFINIEENVWLYNTSADKVWNTNGANISNGEANSNFYVKPVIRLKNSTPLLSGKGTKENPYVVDNTSKNPEIGSIVKLGEDVFNIIKIEDKKAYLVLNTNISTTFRFDTESNVYNLENASSVASYLNNSYLNSLAYKDALEEGTFYTGSYTTSYQDITKTNVKAKVGMLSILDPQIGSNSSRYYLITGAEEGFAYYNNYGILSKSRITISREIRPVVVINVDKLKVGEGTNEVPYTMEG